METHTDNSSYEIDDPESNFLKDNSRKKTYEQFGTETEDDMQPRTDGEQHREDNCLTEDAWEITVSAELKRKLAGPWQTSVIFKLMGKQLGYRALQTRLVGIWCPTGNMNLIDIGYGFFIMEFEVLKDYHHAPPNLFEVL